MDLTELLPKEDSKQALPITPLEHIRKVTVTIKRRGNLLGESTRTLSRKALVS